MRTDHVIDLLSRIRGKAHERIAAALAARGHTGLVPSHGAILALLYEQGPQPLGGLARAIGRRKNTVTTLARKLEAAGYVRRLADPGDNRVTRIALTAKGEAFRADFQAVSTAVLSAFWGAMETGRREVVVAALEEILGNLT